MAAATVHNNAGSAYGANRPDGLTLTFTVMWNGAVIALCSTQAEANAVAALHPA